jgi:hypothetical protein
VSEHKITRNRPAGAITLSKAFLDYAKSRNLEHVQQTIDDLERFRSVRVPTIGRDALLERRKKAEEQLRKLDEALELFEET